MAETEEEIKDEVWLNFLRRHWLITAIIIAGITVAVVGAISLFLWFLLPNAIAASPVLRSISWWTLGRLASFILNVILWEFLIVGIPVIAGAAAIFLLWWRKLPDDEKEEYTGEPKEKGRRVSNSSGGGIFSFLVFITWLIIVWAENNWNTVFVAWSFEYIIYSWLAAFFWDLLIFGTIGGVVLLVWIGYKLKETS